MAGNLGFEVFLVKDATAEYTRTGVDEKNWDAETVHAVNLATLYGEFCRVVGMDDLLAV